MPKKRVFVAAESRAVLIWRLRIGAFFRRRCPSLAAFFNSDAEERKTLKRALGFPVGVAFGLLFHVAVLQRLKINDFQRLIVSLIICLFLGCGFATSPRVRCVSLLTLPEFTGRTGRAVLTTYVAGYLLQGPTGNVMLNAKEAVRSLACGAGMIVNHSLTYFEAYFKPFLDVLVDLQINSFSFEGLAAKVAQAFQYVVREAEGTKETEWLVHLLRSLADKFQSAAPLERMKAFEEKNIKRKAEGAVEANVVEKALFRCEDILLAGLDSCNSHIRKAHRKCTLTVVKGFAWICEILKVNWCNFAKILGISFSCLGPVTSGGKFLVLPGFESLYATGKSVAKNFFKNFFVTLQYKAREAAGKNTTEGDIMTVKEFKESIQYEFDYRKAWVDFVIVTVQRVLAFAFLVVIFDAVAYHRKFRRDVTFDNDYVTFYFRHIDARRKFRGKRTLLPLKKSERAKLIDPWSFEVPKATRKGMAAQILFVLLFAGCASIWVGTDYLVWFALDVVGKNAHMEFYQLAEHRIGVNVTGSGILAKMLRRLFKALNQNYTKESHFNNYECLPHPKHPDVDVIVQMFSCFGIMLVLVYLEAYSLRLRHVITGYFYPKIQKRRILHAYNEALRRRKRYLKSMRHKVKRAAKEMALSERTNVLMALRMEFPRALAWLKCFPGSKRQCLICREPEAKNDYVACDTCNFGYCRECWIDVHRRCVQCSVLGGGGGDGGGGEVSELDSEDASSGDDGLI